MKIGLLLNSSNTLCSYSERFREIIEKNNIPYTIIDPNSFSLCEEIRNCSHLIFRHTQGDTDMKIYDAVFNIANRIYGVECTPNFETFWLYEDKIKEYYLLKSNNFPIVDSYPFWNYSPALTFLRDAHYPLIAKLPKGSSSQNVVLIRSFREGRKIIKQVFEKGVRAERLDNKTNLLSYRRTGLFRYVKLIFRDFLICMGLFKDKALYPEWQIQKDSILFQKFLPNNKYDTRITIIGKRALAFRRFVRENDFRASGSGKIDYDPSKIDKRQIEIAFAISGKNNFNVMAYDFIYGEEGKPYINEISYCFVDWVVQNCPGYWDDKLEWHDGKNWPQYYQLKDFLRRKELVPV